MKRLNLVASTMLVLLVASGLHAQPRLLGAHGVILDDNASNKVYITTSLGGVGINVLNLGPDACAILDLSSQTKGFLPPRMSPTEIALLCGGAPPEGLIVYNYLTHTLDIWNGSGWTGQWQTKGNTNLSADNVDNLLGSTALSTVKPFNLIVGGTRIMRYETTNRIQGGHPSNLIHPSATGAIIAGGGQLGSPNSVTQLGLYSVVSGGRGNVAGGDAGAGDAVVGGGIGNNAAGARTVIGGGYFNLANVNAATIGGGANNTTGASAQYATIGGGNTNTNNSVDGTIGGGFQNNIQSTQFANTIGGGNNNTANVNAFQATISGGSANVVGAGGATIGGGFNNTNNGAVGFIGAGQANAIGSNSFSFIGGGVNNTNNGYASAIGGGQLNLVNVVGWSTLAGGFANTISNDNATIGGGSSNMVTGAGATIAGGQSNLANGSIATVGGGNTNTASGPASTIGGGQGNTASGSRSTVSGGQSNTASGIFSSVGGGANNVASGNNTTIGGGRSNTTNGVGATIAGGGDDGAVTQGNTANGNAATIGGGLNNRATDNYTFVGGGQNNQAGDNAGTIADRTHATVSGGQNNTASGTQSFIGGGLGHNATGTRSTIGGGETNTASNTNDVVGGGRLNLASGSTSTVAGGNNNTANNASATVGGGNSNTASGNSATVAGGSANTASGNFSAIPGGTGMTVGANSFGFNNGSANSSNISGQSDVAYFGNVDVLVANTDNTAQQLRFYENTASTTLAGADFASFQAPAVMTATTQYALPVNFGNAGGGIAPYILADVSGVGSPRQLSWISGNSSNWLLNGNSAITGANFIGTTDAADFVVKTGVGAVERMRVFGAPALNSSAAPLITINNPIPNQQGLRINGTNDAVLGNTLAANPGVWDLVVNGDAVVTGILKMGGSLWFDAAPASDPHAMKANRKLLIGTTTNNDLAFMTNNTEAMYVDSTGRVGIGTKDPVSALHIVATPPQAVPPDTNALGFVTPEPRHHVLTVENMYTPTAYNLYNRGNGIAVVIHTPDGTDITNDGLWNNSRTNYMTFYNANGTKNNIRGRIEGFSYEDYLRMAAGLDVIMDGGELFNPFNWFSFNIDFFDFDPNFIGFDENFLTFNANFISFSGGSLPSLSGGSLPSLTGGSFSFTDGITWPTFSPGSLPSLNPGSLPSISWSAPVVLNGSPIVINGSPLINFENPFTLNQAYIDLKAAQIAALPYKEKAADAVMNPVGAAVKFGASFKAGVTYESGSGDYAEWLERADPKETINFGDVVGVKGGKISKNTEGTNQYMVATWKPIVLGNMPEPGREEDFTKVAFLGQIPVKIVGGCRKGDYILPSGRNDGYAFALSPSRIDAADLDRVLGIAWDDAFEKTPRYVKIAVGLKPHEMVTVIQKQQAQIDQLQEKVNEIDLLKQEMADLKEAVASANAPKVVTAKKAEKKPKFRYKTVSAK